MTTDFLTLAQLIALLRQRDKLTSSPLVIPDLQDPAQVRRVARVSTTTISTRDYERNFGLCKSVARQRGTSAITLLPACEFSGRLLRVRDVIEELEVLRASNMHDQTPLVYQSRDNNGSLGFYQRIEYVSATRIGKVAYERNHCACKPVSRGGVPAAHLI
jgi:hypothetical protein